MISQLWTEMLKEPDTILKDRRMTRVIIVNSCTKIKTGTLEQDSKSGPVFTPCFTATGQDFQLLHSIPYHPRASHHTCICKRNDSWTKVTADNGIPSHYSLPNFTSHKTAIFRDLAVSPLMIYIWSGTMYSCVASWFRASFMAAFTKAFGHFIFCW